MIIDGGFSAIGLESTIIDLSGGEPMILRPGYVTQEKMTQVIGNVDVDRTILDASSKEAPKAPGMKYRHYAPKAIAHHLFEVLRQMDDEEVQLIFTESFAETGLGQATMNRLLKAAGHQVISL